MPLYHFHLRTESGLDRDEDGLTFDDLDAAYLEAYATIPALAEEMLRTGRDPLACTFVISDAADRPALEVPFRERVRDGARPRKSPAQRASCQTERAVHLRDALREQHAELRANLERMRDLVADAARACRR
ncbi:hypothetical protein Q8W71_12970 [Methylobacterium sp. NEAU 140]|uniref:DUF6894 family protein n=1 Tax=Methylobacterium sp. NEAU 140 TaxID=3064945 RepID=UPI002735BB09|nr:hypothetical protein [Methylobacterium sp. NEAU 140]MDP4023543.1 hypothetical protein [Methylobacterium sp. NEAU 140]